MKTASVVAGITKFSGGTSYNLFNINDNAAYIISAFDKSTSGGGYNNACLYFVKCGGGTYVLHKIVEDKGQYATFKISTSVNESNYFVINGAFNLSVTVIKTA